MARRMNAAERIVAAMKEIDRLVLKAIRQENRRGNLWTPMMQNHGVTPVTWYNSLLRLTSKKKIRYVRPRTPFGRRGYTALTTK